MKIIITKKESAKASAVVRAYGETVGEQRTGIISNVLTVKETPVAYIYEFNEGAIIEGLDLVQRKLLPLYNVIKSACITVMSLVEMLAHDKEIKDYGKRWEGTGVDKEKEVSKK